MPGYPQDILRNRSVVKHGNYAFITPEGRVINVIPGIEDCLMTILATPKMGASFVQLIGTLGEKAKTTMPYGAKPHEESFIYLLDGEAELKVSVGGESRVIKQGGYAYAPPGVGISFETANGKEGRILLYKQRYIEHPSGLMPYAVFGNANDMEWTDYDGMANVHIKDLLPVEQNFDMNMHILSFDPGASHNIVETHVQEHGAYVYEGQGCYLLDEDWYLIKKEDFIWFGPYCKQTAYGVGREQFTYIYSKDCHRDVEV
ncbi:(S)-ureidoglycine aminohydrolase [Neisseria chenwenguii]|uniref:(S)-ureidoglycine aminohydrolase n=1 Tax=Neisseria chenwenguii TaxID=1853278 RepID=A0A220S0S9_9NEIS|nr:(S)-ureidoglycine aminohydrolase [Neisseria chenwenguii]ASK26988.1 (S)-ureidoglycine aminohydrolase [Neisseria chenwenguii]ROV56111.1 (S)-ureidoglycine aminohydrolase [Neisseria chenwenguii]